MTKSLLAILMSLFIFVGSAQAYTEDKTMTQVASKFAGHKVHALCYARGEGGGPGSHGAWGSVFVADHSHLEMSYKPCIGLRAIIGHYYSVNPWLQALGALTLTHEAYHQRLDLSDRTSEAKTECRAIRHFKYAVQFLGGSKELADYLYPYALTIHFRVAAPGTVYSLDTCKVPWGI